ncbi:MAG: hypothetical protein Kow00121_56090 [Elainellaceae cyanobacterium]
MNEEIVQVSTFPGWIVGVSRNGDRGFLCWVVNPDLNILCDRRNYETSNAAMLAGRMFVENNLSA